jgi:signal transduction histidine kinase
LSDLAADHPSPVGSAQREATAAHSAHRRSSDVDAEQVASLVATAVGGTLIAYTAWGFAAPWHIGIWLLGLCIIAFVRYSFAQHIQRKPPANPSHAFNTHLLSTLAVGATIGSAALIFADLPPLRQALLTLILMCWSAVAVFATAAHVRAFQAYTIPMLAPLALVWALGLSLDGVMIAAVLGIFCIVLTVLARDNGRMARSALEIRHDNARLIDELAREQQEAALARAAASSAERAKSRFLTAAGHDLRQPLHALSLYSAAMQLRPLEGDAGHLARNINDAVVSLSGLVDSLLDVSRLDAGAVQPKFQRIDLTPFLAQIDIDLRPSARNRGLEFHVSIDRAEIESDPALLERLIRNLVDNAIKHTAHGSVTLAAAASEREVCISVCDTGPGIAAEERERIFEEFYQIGNPERDRAHGLGVGLAIVRRLATLLNVQIELQSTLGQGSIFTVRLPRAAARNEPEPSAPMLPPRDARPLAGVDILVIDDEPAVRDGMRTLLDSWGCHTLACGGLTEARQALSEQPFDVDVIVADLRLRQHENGIDTVRELRRSLGQVPALLVSGETSLERLREVQLSGLPLLPKPVSAARLQEALLAVLGGKQ